jgi:hypothetical protein
MSISKCGWTPRRSWSARKGRSVLSLSLAAGAAVGAGGVAQGQVSRGLSDLPVMPALIVPGAAGLRGNEQTIGLGHLDVLRAVAHGFHGQGGTTGVGRSCNTIATLTDASFTGGSYILEAGMAQGEMAAATYTVAASEFPIKINLTEVILATSSATVQTTTQWSMLYYSGTPTNGTLVDTFSSDGVVLPYAVVGPGTAGVVVQFSVDPGDPNQLYIPDNGSHQFTVAFRIDHHNQQTQDPCSVPPPNCCNAFPVVDTSGVQYGAADWVYALNCGPLGCPGGWSTFNGYLCEPSGDWVMRTTWSGVNCTPGVGACCQTDGTCQVEATSNCTGAGGTYQGDGTSCATVNCPVPNGACCFTNGSCLSRTQASCTSLGGTWLGGGTTCSGTSCPTGACCFANGTCQALTSSACTSQGGTFHGVGVACANANCPQPTGACCTGTGGCDLLSHADCTTIGGTWLGAGSTCASCTPTGACCTSGNGCDLLTQADCTTIGGAWRGANTPCTQCQPACYANCDGSTTAPVLNVADFTCFLQKYAAADVYANCDQSTTPPVLNVADFTCFLQKYAAGCP